MFLLACGHWYRLQRASGILPDFDEVDCAPATLAQAHASGIPKDVPVVLITAMGMGYVPEDKMDAVKKMWEAKLRFHNEWLEKLPNGRHIVTDRSGHLVPYEEPQLVIDAIREVVDQAKQRSTQKVRSY